MKAPVMCGSVILLIGTLASLGSCVPDNMATGSDLLIRERRDEEPQYADDYDSGEQDRWPSLDELSHRKRLSSKRGRLVSGLASLEEAKKAYITRRQDLENSLSDLLSTRPRPALQKRTIDTLKDMYMAELPKRPRLPRSPEEATLEPSKDQPGSGQHTHNESATDPSG